MAYNSAALKAIRNKIHNSRHAAYNYHDKRPFYSKARVNNFYGPPTGFFMTGSR